ncbi:MAG TPA: chitobiase/beta-hexosaminidase C-terminal domain-containing protein, partial [Verrucomicrobiales bacterium]|nr:chitobiase/beta-hexosaminidase C-terminal domain-containing protein [Verrucomicrobiales bacterium]
MRAIPLSLLAVILSLGAALPVSGTPVISEFQAENKDTIKDADGNNSDWLEIYNPDATAVDLAGMALTDDPLVPQKWVFPSISVASKASLLVWCTGKNLTNPAGPLHTNFSLAKEGGYLAFTAVDGTTKLTEWNPYPAQVEDRSYGSSKPVLTQTPVAAGASCRWRVPTAEMSGWATTGFVDTAWTAANTGIGYDTETTYLSLFGTGGTVPTGTVSCYIRIPFAFTNPADVQTMTLRVKYDDGFAAFLNGTRLNPTTTTNAPASLLFNSPATTTHNDTDAVVFQSFDVSAQKSLLVSGSNVLAIQALNQSSASTDFLLVPELQVTRVDSTSAADVGYFAVPTPGVSNSAATVAGFVDAPDFSVKRGFFTSPVQVTLTTKTPGAQIRYTTNGTAPTATTGSVYSVPLTISASSVLRAGAFLSGWQPSTVKSHTYLFAAQVVNQPAAPAGYPTTWGNEYDFTFFTLTGPAVPADYRMDPGITGNATYGPLIVPALTTTLPVISLSGDITQIFGAANGIYSNGRITPGLELAASMEFWVPGGTENWQENIGLRMHGGDAPLEHPKKPFRVYFRKEYGAGRLQQPLYPGSPVESFDKLQLRPGGHDGWSVPFGSGNESLARHAVYCRDRFLRQTELDMGRLSHRGRYAHLFINGLYWGFYDLHEVQSQEFFSDHLGGEDEDWDVVEHSNTDVPLFNVVDGTGAAMDAALALVRPASNAGNQSTYDQLQTYINYDELIDNMIVQMWGGQNDWLGPVFRGTPGVNLTNAARFFNKNWEAGRRSRGANPSDFFFQVWDAEISMGNSLSGSVLTMRVSDFNHTLVGTPTTDVSDTGSTTRTAGTPGPPAEIYYALRKYNPQFRMRFADRLQKHFFNTGAMTVARNQARLQSFRDLLDLPIVAESARWGDVNSGDPTVVTFNRDDHWRTEMDWLKNTYVATRNNTLLTQFRALGMWPTTAAPSYSQYGGAVPSGYQLTITD